MYIRIGRRQKLTFMFIQLRGYKIEKRKSIYNIVFCIAHYPSQKEATIIYFRENYNYRTRNNALRYYRTPNIDFAKTTLETLALCYT